jgi:hypothetical protein
MRNSRHTGRAAVPRTAGKARVGHAIGRAATPERAPTDVLRLDSDQARPVFVDPSGVRRRLLRRIGYALGTALLLIVLVLWLSQLGTPVRPRPPDPCATAGLTGTTGLTGTAGPAASAGPAGTPPGGTGGQGCGR